MDFAILIPVTLFVCVYLSIKAVVDARTRRQMVATNGSEDMLRSILEGEESRRLASLRWGVVLVALALGFAGIEAFGWTEASPGVFALLLGATGIGNLVAFVLTRRIR